MKKIIWILVALAISAGGYFVYKRVFSSDNLVASIPNDAAVVMAVDLKSIAQKAGGESLLTMNFMKRIREELKKNNDPSFVMMNELLDDPMKSGLNFLNRAYVFVTVKDEKPMVGLVCGILNSGAFEEMIRKIPMKDSIVASGKIKTLHLQNMGLMGWNTKEVILLGGMGGGLDDEYLKGLFTHSSSITSISHFNKFNDTKFDAGVFVNYASLLSITKKMSTGPAAMMADLYKDTYADMTTHFEKNSVVTDMHYYIDNKETEEKLKMLNEKGIGADHLKQISDKKVLGILSSSIDMKKFIGFFDSNVLLSGMIMEVATQAGISKDELKDLLTGDITLALTDVRNELTTKKKYNFDSQTGAMSIDEVADTMMTPLFTATIGIKTRATFEKLMNRAGLKKEGPYYTINTPVINLYMVENKVGITLTNDKLLADKIADKKELAELGEPAKSIVTGSAMGFYIDLDYKNYPENLFNTMHQRMGEDGFTAFKNTTGIFKDLEIKSNKSGGVMELNLNEGAGDNSLHRIIDAIDKNVYPLMTKMETERKNERVAMMIADSIAVAEADRMVSEKVSNQ